MSYKECNLVAHGCSADPAIFCDACVRITVWGTRFIYGMSFQWDSQVLYIYSHLLVCLVMQSYWSLSLVLTILSLTPISCFVPVLCRQA